MDRTFNYICARRSNKRFVSLYPVKKDGTPGKLRKYECYGNEKTAEDVIKRLESLNPGRKWMVA